MPGSSALNRTGVVMLTNKSGGDLPYGAVVIIDTGNDESFTTTTTAGLSTRGIGVIVDPAGIANNAVGRVATDVYVPQVNLDAAAGSSGQFIKASSVAGQATPHNAPQVEGDFGYVLGSGTSPAAVLFGSPNGPTGTVSDGDKGDLTVSGGGTVWTIDPTAVTFAKMQDASALSLLGRSANSTGVMASIAAGSDHQVMRRSGTAIGFGAVDLSQSAAVTGLLGRANAGVSAAAANVVTNETTTSLAYTDLATPGPAVSLVTGTSVIVWLACHTRHTGDGNTAFMAFAISGATTVAANNDDGIHAIAECGLPAFSLDNCLSRVLVVTGLTPGTNTFTAKYKVDGSTFGFHNRSIAVLALP